MLFDWFTYFLTFLTFLNETRLREMYTDNGDLTNGTQLREFQFMIRGFLRIV